MAMKHNISEPLSKKDNYDPFDNVDFIMDFEGEKIVANSIRLSGDLWVQSVAGTWVVVGDDIKFDSKCGIHGFFSQFTLEFQNKGVINSYQYYPRLVRMKSDATKSLDDMFNSDDVVELKTARDPQTKYISMGLGSPAGTPANAPNTRTKPSFYMTPLIPLNEMAGNMSYTQSGQIKISVQLQSASKALYGNQVTNNTTFQLSNLRMHYLTIPDDGVREKVVMRSHYSIKQNMSSSANSITAKVPAIADSVSCSFIQTGHENSLLWNEYETERIKDIDQLQFLFNDTITYIDFPIMDEVEILDNYVSSLTRGEPQDQEIKCTHLDRDSDFGIGLYWAKFVDFTNNKFSLYLRSTNISNTNQYDIYLYFHGLIAID